MGNQLGDAPVEDEYRTIMRAVGVALDNFLNGSDKEQPRKVGFVLLVFPFGEEGRCSYISNGADHKDVVVLMKKQISRLEGAPDVSGMA
jgi:hypothetical protein